MTRATTAGFAPTAIATVVAFVVGYATIAWLLRYVRNHNFDLFVDLPRDRRRDHPDRSPRPARSADARAQAATATSCATRPESASTRELLADVDRQRGARLVDERDGGAQAGGRRGPSASSRSAASRSTA